MCSVLDFAANRAALILALLGKIGMCGIVGYIGKQNAVPISLDGLKRLEYRGYDSAGIAFFDPQKHKIVCAKAMGRVNSLEYKIRNANLFSNSAIAHTRWATHGVPSEKNAHPHFDCKKNIYLVHNGIIENYKFLKDKLKQEGHKFVSETDTEVLAHLIEKFFKGNLEEAVSEALKMVKGTYGIAVISKDDPGKIVVARNSSPLLVGLGNEEFIIASDPSAVVSHTNKVVYLEDGEVATITPKDFSIVNLKQKKIFRPHVNLKWDFEEATKGGFPHFMLKEIFEIPEAIENSTRGRLIVEEGLAKMGGLELVLDELRKASRLVICACGTSYYASLVGEYMIEEYGGVPTEVEYASEFRYRKPILDQNTAFLAVSQSGETADTLAALREVKRKGILSLGMVNVIGSSIARETDAGIYNHVGPEIGVAATKTFISQVTIFALLSLLLGRQRDLSQVMGQRIAKEILLLPKKVKEILKLNSKIKNLAKKYKNCNHFLYMGRKYNYPTALEGALKIKEISYLHAEGMAAGETKHGPIAMIDKNFPTFAIVLSDSVYEKMISNIMEIKARGGKVIALASIGDEEIKKIVDDVIYIPKTLEMLSPILAVIPLQLFAYHMGVLRGCDVDKPRNLAKSVTVE